MSRVHYESMIRFMLIKFKLAYLIQRQQIAHFTIPSPGEASRDCSVATGPKLLTARERAGDVSLTYKKKPPKKTLSRAILLPPLITSIVPLELA